MRSDNSKIKEVFKDLVFSEDEIAIIESVFHKVKVKKGTIVCNAGDYVDTQYYIIDGCLRAYHVDAHGREHTVQFGIKDWWISDITSFFTSEVAIMTLEAIQDSTLYKISRADTEYLYNKIPKIERFFRIKLERALASFHKRILENLSLNASERDIKIS